MCALGFIRSLFPDYRSKTSTSNCRTWPNSRRDSSARDLRSGHDGHCILPSCTTDGQVLSPKFTIDHLLGGQGEATETSPSSFDPSADQQPNEKPHRRRSTFTALQVHVLENEFFKHRYVSPEKRAGLAAFLGLSQQQVGSSFR
ncbi:hypothetical protein M3Y99_00498500 [Aphelenchoides fujianensis]|nr:hypothetical protein M3Y99_00498500 [Aphelenchoides fujianensis]